jgi:hypothetical protein
MADNRDTRRGFTQVRRQMEAHRRSAALHIRHAEILEACGAKRAAKAERREARRQEMDARAGV